MPIRRGRLDARILERREGSITFRVDAVRRAREPLPERRGHEALAATLGAPLLSCSDYSGRVVAGVDTHPLLHAAHLAFSQHRPLVLTPDAIWLTIAQGFAHHVALHAEELRSRLVGLPGRRTLFVNRPDFALDSPENPWPEVFAEFSRQLRELVDEETHRLVVGDFSTTGPAERAAYELVLMDAFQPYVDYALACMCGIPAIVLEGNVDDWLSVSARVERLSAFGLEWWTGALRRACRELVRAATGRIDRPHWAGIYKLRQAYGGERINGWLAQFVPYLRDAHTGRLTVRNPLLDDPAHEGIRSDSLPSGLASAPLTVLTREGRQPLELVGGLVGVTQDPTGLALRPKVGWAVQRAPRMSRLLLRLSETQTTEPARPPAEVRQVLSRLAVIPGELTQLYLHCDGATIRDARGDTRCRLLPLEALRQVGGTGLNGLHFVQAPAPTGGGTRRTLHCWLTIASLPDGSHLALDLLPEREGRHRVMRYRDPDRLGEVGGSRIVAYSLAEMLEHALGDAPAWPDHGDALRGAR